MPISPDHFKGKTIPDHLKEARMKGALASSEIHGIEMPGHIAAMADTAKEIAFASLIIWVIGTQLGHHSVVTPLLILFCFGWCIWKVGRSALLGLSRIERLHRVIEEEKWEIEHHREQEREELIEIYQAKGFTGDLLNNAIDVLMADDNRLLQIMLEEELGLTLEVYEHPLKQSAGAALGGIATSACVLLTNWIAPQAGLPFIAACIIVIATTMATRLEKNNLLHALVWNLSLGILTAGGVYFLAQLIF